MAESIFASFKSAHDAQAAFGELIGAGLPEETITVLSSEPMEWAPAPPESNHSRIGLFSIGGGVLGGLGAILLTVTTSRSMSLVTGGMPVVAPWAFGIIVFESIALVAILSAVGRMFVESGLGRRSSFVQAGTAIDGDVAMEIKNTSEAHSKIAIRCLQGKGAKIISV